MTKRPFPLFFFVLILLSWLFVPRQQASAATYRNHVARVPETPNSTQTVTIWMDSDTAFGETAGIEYKIGSSYTKVLAAFDNSGYPGANWRAEIPAQANGTFVEYQLFTRNQFGSDYGFTGFNWNYTVNDGDIQWDGLRHDTFDSYYRSPFGAVAAGSSVTLRFRTFPFDVDGVNLRVYQYDPATQTTSGPTDYPLTYLEDRVENSINYAIWSITLNTPASPAILYYKFRITDRLDEDYYSDAYNDNHDNLGQGGEGNTSDNEPFPAFQLTAYDPAFQTPAWLQHANVYQIFPDRFRNGDITNDYCRAGNTIGCPTFYGSETPIAHTTWNESIYDPRQPGPYFNAYGNQFFGGDLQGITQQLDYLQSLGIDTLYLTPIFLARSNHRYDTDDYLTVDPALGGDAAFQALVTELEQRGMYLILDGVFNHTSSDSLYFDRYGRYPSDGACESLASTYRPWYVFFNSNTPCGSGDYEGWFGFDSLAVLLDGNSAVRDFIYRTPGNNVVEHWYTQGANGWRFDVADEISHNWWRDFRPYAKTDNAQGPLVGEVWYDASQFLLGDQLDAVMNYRFRKNILGFARGVNWNDNDNNGSNFITGLTPSQFDHALQAVREDYPPQATAAMLNLVSSHDTNRTLYVLTLLGDTGLTEAKERLRLTALFQFTYLGAPMVYYGDEAGIDSPSLANGVNGPEDDPYNRAPYPWADEGGDTDVYGPADSSLINTYSQLAHLRKEHVALRTGAFATLLTGDTTTSGSDNNTYAFARSGGGETAVIALNNGSGSNSADIPVSTYFADGTQLQDALSGTIYTVSGGTVSVTLAARSGVILFLAPASADTTAPTAAINAAPPANGNGWHNTAVTVNLSGSDSQSGMKELRYWLDNSSVNIVAGSVTSLTLSSEGSTLVNVRAVDNAANISSLTSQTVQIDLTDPTINGSAAPMPNINGWNNTAVSVTFSCSDALSGVDSCGPNQNLTTDGANQSVTGDTTDLAGNTASATVSNINIDQTPPTISAAPDRAANGNNWYDNDVTVTFTCNDALSGIDSCPAPQVVGEGGGQTINGTATDLAGNSASDNLTLNVDKTAPVITFDGQTPPANGNGWNNTDITLDWSCTDGLSGVVNNTISQTLTAEGSNQSASATCTDLAGLTASDTQTNLSIDKTAPSVAVTGVTDGATYTLGSVPVAGCSTSDALSGVATYATVTITGGNPDGTGTFYVTCTGGSDNADNVAAPVSASYTVVAPPSDVIYVSSSSGGTVASISFADEDILAYDSGSNSWSLFFDGSDVGLAGTNLDAFEQLPDDSILFSVGHDNVNLAGAGLVDDSDIVRFIPTSTGSTTAGTMELYFDASDVLLTASSEDVDALNLTTDGKIIISTIGNVSVGFTATDEDLLIFTPTSLGSSTSGTWALYFDGSDVGLGSGSEDVVGVWVDPLNGDLYLTTAGAFSVSGSIGDGADIFVCHPITLGSTTSCTFGPGLYWDGSTHGFAGEVVDAVVIVR